MWSWLWKGRQKKHLSLQDQDALPAARVSVEGFSDQSWQGERSLLDALDRANVPVRSSCRSGNCGACLAYLKAGKVAYTKEVTFPLEVGEILMCSCVPLSPLIICLPDKPVGTDRRR